MPSLHASFLKHAFKNPLGAATRHKFSQQQVTQMMNQSIKGSKVAEMIDYLPT